MAFSSGNAIGAGSHFGEDDIIRIENDYQRS
jgi:hypothetical protein